MVDVRKVDIVAHYAQSGPAAVALRRELQRRDDLGMPDPTEQEIIAFVEEAERKNVYGFDYKTDRNGNPIPVGVGAAGHENFNHYQSIRRYEGQAAWEKAVRKLCER